MEVNNSQNIGPTEVAVVNIVGGYVVVTTVGNIKTFILEHEDNRFQGFELKNMQSADSEEFIGVSKPVCPISGAEKLSTPRLVSSKSSEHLEDTHKASKRMIKMSSSIFQFEKGKHYQVVVCSKGAYDNLDPNIVGKEACQKTTTTTANNRSNYQENHTEKRSKWMTQKLCDIFNIPEVQSEEIPSLNILSKAFEHYNETMAMKINKKVLEGTTIEMHYRTHSSDEEKQDQQETCTITTTPPTPRDKIGEKWDSLFNSVGEGNPGFVAFAIFPYYQKESMVSKVNQDL
jgi:hypothetical protein